LFCGFPRQRGRGPTFYPVACTPQAWAAAAPLYLLQSCLGVSFDPEQERITFDNPVMPDFLGEVRLHNLALGGETADISIRRSGGQVVVEVLRKSGRIRVVTLNG